MVTHLEMMMDIVGLALMLEFELNDNEGILGGDALSDGLDIHWD